MTVLVIKTEPDKSVVKETICRNCGVTLQYVPHDIQERTERDYTGDTDVIYYIDCPACSGQVTVQSY
jgi:hypothetical protein